MWVHPLDRDNLSKEMSMLKKAWKAELARHSMTESRPLPEWAEAVFQAFEALNPGFVRHDAMTPEWKAEKNASYAEYYKGASNKEADRKSQILEMALSNDWDGLVTLKVQQVELPTWDYKAGSSEWQAFRKAIDNLVWGRGERAVAVK